MTDAPNTKTVLEGDLSAIQLPDILSFLAMIRATGRLVVRHDELERSMHWREGEVIFATSTSFEHTLGQFLLRNGKIDREQFEESRRRVTPEMRHGKVLVQMGAISPKDLWWSVKNQVLEIIYSLFAWKEGHFRFDQSPDMISTEQRIVLQMSSSSIIMEGVRRLDESARIREKITSLEMVFALVHGVTPDFEELDLSEPEILLFQQIDGRLTIRELIGRSEMTEFEVTRMLFQLVTARLVEVVTEERSYRPVFLDVEDSPELLKIVSSYNGMFGRLYEALQKAVGDDESRDIFMTVFQTADSNELWSGVFFDQFGRFDENMLIGNISELPFERRRSVLEEGLNTLLSIQLFEVSQHLDSAAKMEIFGFIAEQKAVFDAT
jgi:Domain of unknown function (DUF4388)